MNEFRAVISGRVQMVMMRDFVRRSAKSLGVTGKVKNLPDGTVEVVAQGCRETLRVLTDKLHKGSVFSRVDNVEVEWREPRVTYESFTIEY